MVVKADSHVKIAISASVKLYYTFIVRDLIVTETTLNVLSIAA